MYILICILFILFIILVLKKYYKKEYQGFSQDCEFSLKTNGEIYDEFYVSIYDNIHKPQKYLRDEYNEILNVIKPSKHAVLLEISPKTGHFLNLLDKDYTVYGLEESRAMISKANEYYTDLNIVNNTCLNNQIFDKGMFDCIFMLNFSVYPIYDKLQLFGNCYYWLKPSGQFIVHLVNKNKYNPLAEIANKNMNPQQFSNERITKCNVKNHDIEYSQQTNFMKDSRVVVKESFTDMQTLKTRQNELTLYMPEHKEIEKMVLRCGFTVKAVFALNKDSDQYIYVFKKINF